VRTAPERSCAFDRFITISPALLLQSVPTIWNIVRIHLPKSLAYAATFAAGVAIFAAITLGQINRIDRRGTIADAQAMLEKTVVALKSNKTNPWIP
jgi:hypothetical protein